MHMWSNIAKNVGHRGGCLWKRHMAGKGLIFVWKVLEKYEKWHLFCAHAHWWSPWRLKKCRKRHFASSNLTLSLPSDFCAGNPKGEGLLPLSSRIFFCLTYSREFLLQPLLDHYKYKTCMNIKKKPLASPPHMYSRHPKGGRSNDRINCPEKRTIFKSSNFAKNELRLCQTIWWSVN